VQRWGQEASIVSIHQLKVFYTPNNAPYFLNPKPRMSPLVPAGTTKTLRLAVGDNTGAAAAAEVMTICYYNKDQLKKLTGGGGQLRVEGPRGVCI
jgi:hypothetical protein